MAFEARTRDAGTGEIVMLAADREAEQFAPIDARGLTWYSDAEGIIDEWSNQFVLITNAKPGEKIPGTSTFRLLPWQITQINRTVSRLCGPCIHQTGMDAVADIVSLDSNQCRSIQSSFS